jgi:WD40 repeat protein
MRYSKHLVKILLGLLILIFSLSGCDSSSNFTTSSPGINSSPSASSKFSAAPTASQTPIISNPTSILAKPPRLQLLYSTNPSPGHLSQITVLAFSPDGKTLASGAYDQTVRLWEIATGKELQVLKDPTGAMARIAFSPDGKLLATASSDFTIRLWEVATGKILSVLKGHSDVVDALAFSPDGQILASGSSDDTIKLWEISSRKLLTTLTGHTIRINSLAFSPDGKLLVSGSNDWTVKLWEIPSGKELKTFEGNTSQVLTVSFSPDGQTIASLNGDQTIKLWKIGSTSNQPVFSLPYQDYPPQGGNFLSRPLVFSADGKTVLTLTLMGLQRWDTQSGKALATMHFESSKNNRQAILTLSADGQKGAFVELATSEAIVKLMESSSGRVVTSFIITQPSPFSRLDTVVFSPDGKLYATGGWEVTQGNTNYNQVVQIGEVASHRIIKTIKGPYEASRSLAFSPDSQILAGVGTAPPPQQPPDKAFTGNVKTWDVSTGKLIWEITGHTNGVSSLAFSPDQHRLATGGSERLPDPGNGSVHAWDTNLGQGIFYLHGSRDDPLHNLGYVSSVAYSPDGKLLAATTYGYTYIRSNAFNVVTRLPVSGTVQLWNAFTGRSLTVLASQTGAYLSLAFSPDGSLLAVGNQDHSIQLWEVNQGTPKLLATLSGHSGGVNQLKFSPDSKILASGSSDWTVKLWDVEKRQEVFSTTPEQTYGLQGLDYSSDGKLLISGHLDGTIKFWQIIT